MPCTFAYAQSSAVNELKAKIFDARMAQKLFVKGLRFCNEFDGTNFYFEANNRVLKLEDYRRSLENLAAAEVYNSQTRRPWTLADANARWQQARQQALEDKENCALVGSLPELEKKLEELEGKREGLQKKD